MFESIGFTLTGLIFLVIVFVVYLTKKKYNSLQNKLFKFLLVFTLIMLFEEIIYVYTMMRMDEFPVFNELMCRTYLYSTIIWMTTFFFYVWSINIKGNEKNLFKNYERKVLYIIIIISIIFCVIDSFFKIEYKLDNNMYVIAGPATYIIYGITGILMIFTVIFLIKNKKKYTINLRVPIYFVLLAFFVDTIFNFLIIDINDLTFFLSCFICGLYFTIESQDRLILEELEKASIEANAANSAKTEFLSNMSHEIRTPMNTILGLSDSLIKDNDFSKERVHQDIENIHDAGLDLLDLINNILDISRIESGKEELYEKEYALSNILLELDSIVNSKVAKNNTTFEMNINEKIANVYYGDSVKVYKILLSIIYAAIKYTSFGKITLDVDSKQIDDKKNEIVFIVSNTGHAMTKADFDIEFNDFVKLEEGAKNNIDSVLLGIIIAKRYLAMMDSSIEFINKPDQGTKYIIRIKQSVVDNAAIGNIFQSDEFDIKNKIVDCSGKKVLIVDDNKVNLKLAEKIFKNYNFDVKTITTGKECIDLVKQNDYDVIFLDHMMPEMDGIETIHRLKGLPVKLPPVIVLTANSYTGLKEKYIDEGFTDYLSKPIKINDLNKIIYNIFK